jgi:hypothetical protein
MTGNLVPQNSDLSSDTSILTPQNSDTLIGDTLPFTDDAPFIAPKGILALVILVPVPADLFRALSSITTYSSTSASFSVLDFAGQTV